MLEDLFKQVKLFGGHTVKLLEAFKAYFKTFCQQKFIKMLQSIFGLLISINEH